jgi:hypothetical protein
LIRFKRTLFRIITIPGTVIETMVFIVRKLRSFSLLHRS